MGGEVRFYKLVETSGFVAKEQREAKRRHNSKTNQQTNKKKWFIQTSDSCTIPKTLFAGPFFKSNNWSIDSWQNILRDTSALTDKIQKCYNKVIISPVKGFFLFFFSPQALGFFHIPYEWKISHLKYPFSRERHIYQLPFPPVWKRRTWQPDDGRRTLHPIWIPHFGIFPINSIILHLNWTFSQVSDCFAYE